MWFELVEQYIRLAKLTAPPSDLTSLFQMFIEKRSSDEFIVDTVSSATNTQVQFLFKSDYPDVYEMLRNAENFQKKCSDGEYDIRKG